ncbi:MAG TPA: hypothetical protein VL424_02760, partial [Pararobbsia sp.]|nr:hypothetical protein [Pararobbsia sp.]
MTGIDPAVASALVSRIDALLSAVDSPNDAKSAQALDGPAATQWANAQLANVPEVDAPPPASAQAVLSQTARALDVISRGADGEPAPPVVGRQALWPASPASGVQGQAFAGLASSLAMALEQALDTSGLFYESHLVQWLAGQRSGALLSQEPQSQLPGATDNEGWSYDAEAMLRELADAPTPFMGERAASGIGDTGSETIDVEIDDGFADTNGANNAANSATGANGTSGTAVSNPGNGVQAGAQPGAQPGDGVPYAAARLTQGSGDVLDAWLLDGPGDPGSDDNTNAGAGTSLALTARAGGPADADAANGPAAQTAAARAAPGAPGYTPTAGSMLFANAGNAAYAAQAAAQVRPSADASLSAADRAATAAAQNDPTLQASGTP